MLDVFNNLQPFFEDCHRRYSVREYARIRHVSPPTASVILSALTAQHLLNKQHERQYIFFWANHNSAFFRDLARIYWRQRLEDVGLINHLTAIFTTPTIILFGSLAKGENTRESDVDIAIISPKRDIHFAPFEKKLGRTIQSFIFTSISTIKNKELLQSILNGYLLEGRVKV